MFNLDFLDAGSLDEDGERLKVGELTISGQNGKSWWPNRDFDWPINAASGITNLTYISHDELSNSTLLYFLHKSQRYWLGFCCC